MAIEIGGAGGGREALHARADRHGDHVLLEPLVVADAGIAAGRQHVDEAVLGDHLQPDVGIGREEGRHDRGQHQPRRADRHVEAERAGRPVAKAVHHIERRLDLAQRRAEPLEQARARFGRGDAARRAVEQPDAELGLQPAHRLAQARRRCCRWRARPSRKPPARATATKAVEIAEIRRHCSPFRTACADCSLLSRSSTAVYICGRRQRRRTMTDIDKAGTFTLGERTVKRLGYGAMQLAGPGVFGPPRDRDAAHRRAARGGGERRRTTSTPATSTARTSPTSSSARRCTPTPTISVIVTKIGARRGADGSWMPAFSAEELTQAVHDNLRNLGLDVLDVVNLRIMFDVARPRRGLDRGAAHRAGRAAAAGPGAPHRPEQRHARRRSPRAAGSAEIVCVQNQYNLAHRDDDALIDELAARRHRLCAVLPARRLHARCSRRRLSDVAARLGATPMQVALAWLLAARAQHPADPRHLVGRASAREPGGGRAEAAERCGGGAGPDRGGCCTRVTRLRTCVTSEAVYLAV